MSNGMDLNHLSIATKFIQFKHGNWKGPKGSKCGWDLGATVENEPVNMKSNLPFAGFAFCEPEP